MSGLKACPMCGNASLRRRQTSPSIFMIVCENCGCTAPEDSWPKAGTPPYEVIAWFTTNQLGELKITRDKGTSGSWKELGMKVDEILDKVRVNHA